MKKVLVTGASGYTGQFLLDALQMEKFLNLFEIAGTYTGRKDGLPVGVRQFHLDMTDASSCADCLRQFVPDVVVNLAAMSSPVACEKSIEEAAALNVPRIFLEALRVVNSAACFIHLSTDQVFDGEHAPYSQGSAPNPVNAYGRTKLECEVLLRECWKNHYILRSSLICGPVPPRPCGKASFVQFLDTKLAEGAKLELFQDEVRSAIYVADVISVILELAESQPQLSIPDRTLHMGGPEPLDRLSMGKAVCAVRGFSPDLLVGVLRASVDTGVRSPLDISMDSNSVQELCKLKFWTFSECLPLVFAGEVRARQGALA